MASVAATPTYLLQAIRKGSFTMRGLARYKYVHALTQHRDPACWCRDRCRGRLGRGLAALACDARPPRERHPPGRCARAYSLSYGRLVATTTSSSAASLVRSRSRPSSVRLLLLTAVRRVGLVTGLLGGAGLGSAFGVLAFYGKDYVQEDKPLLPASGEKPIPTQDVPK